jgi:hypothetical protein
MILTSSIINTGGPPTPIILIQHLNGEWTGSSWYGATPGRPKRRSAGRELLLGVPGRDSKDGGSAEAEAAKILLAGRLWDL